MENKTFDYCPNASNKFHSCTTWCEENWKPIGPQLPEFGPYLPPTDFSLNSDSESSLPDLVSELSDSESIPDLETPEPERVIPDGMSLTENGSLAWKSTGDSTVDLNTQLVRGVNEERILPLISKAASENLHRFVSLCFYNRDCINSNGRNGKGERDSTWMLLRWLYDNKPKTFVLNFETLVRTCGRWKDVLEVGIDSTLVLDVMLRQLKEDRDSLATGKRPSLCAKWSPAEKGKHTKEARFLAKSLFPSHADYMRRYRKLRTSLLREIDLLEQKMSDGNWESIDPSKVPAGAMRLYGRQLVKKPGGGKHKGSFYRHLEEKMNDYLSSVQKGEKKMKVSGLQPHQIVSGYLERNGYYGLKVRESVDPVLEEQWKEIDRQTAIPEHWWACVDVSGSMNEVCNERTSVTCMEVALALGLFFKHIVTFHSEPTIFHPAGETLRDRVESLLSAPWGMNTNFEKVFDLILQSALLTGMSKEKMEKTVCCVFTDMQFDSAKNDGSEATLYQKAKQRFSQYGYPLPKLVYMNLRSSVSAHPVKITDQGTCIISGFSEKVLKVIMDGSLDLAGMTALSILEESLLPYASLVKVDPNEI